MNDKLIKEIENYYKKRYGTMNGFQYQLGEIIEIIKNQGSTKR